MNPNPYRTDVESILFKETDWRSEYQEAAAERDHWQDRAYRLERELEVARQKLAAQSDTMICIVPRCTWLRSKHSRLGLCDMHLPVSRDDMEAMWRELAKSQPEQVPAHVRQRLEREAKPWVVYYIRLEGKVKIGRTYNLARRLNAFYATPDQLLAVEPGVVVDGLDRERQRHREFAEWRIAGTELFTPSDALTRHIAEVVSTFGDPKRYL